MNSVLFGKMRAITSVLQLESKTWQSWLPLLLAAIYLAFTLYRILRWAPCNRFKLHSGSVRRVLLFSLVQMKELKTRQVKPMVPWMRLLVEFAPHSSFQGPLSTTSSQLLLPCEEFAFLFKELTCGFWPSKSPWQYESFLRHNPFVYPMKGTDLLPSKIHISKHTTLHSPLGVWGFQAKNSYPTEFRKTKRPFYSYSRNRAYYSKHCSEMFSLAISLTILFFKYLYWYKIKQTLNVKNIPGTRVPIQFPKFF